MPYVNNKDLIQTGRISLIICTVICLIFRTPYTFAVITLTLVQKEVISWGKVSKNEPRREKTGLRGFRPGPT